MASARTVVVVGGGVIGLSIALEVAERGLSCTVVDPSPGRGASWAAAGMLSPAAEVAPGEEPLLDDLVDGARRWPAFAERLAAVSGIDVGFESTGSVLIGATPSDAREVDRLAGLVARSGLEVSRLSPADLVALEPALDGGRMGGWLLPGDHRVDNRLVVDALLAGVKALGAMVVEDRCASLRVEGDRIVLELEHQGALEADRFVLAMGAAPPLPGTEALDLPVVRPVRGTTLRLGASADAALPCRTVRAVVEGEYCYLVPRRDGSLVVGATSEEQGYEVLARAGGVADLLRAARRILPCLDELVFEEAAAGLRPATPDHLPIVRRLADPRVVVATGHYRNGILLAPLAGVQGADLLDGTA